MNITYYMTSITTKESAALLIRLSTLFCLLLLSACLTQSSKSSAGIPTASPASIPSSSSSSNPGTSSSLPAGSSTGMGLPQETSVGIKTANEPDSQTSDSSRSNGDQAQKQKSDDQILAEALDEFDNKMKSRDQQPASQASGSQTSTAEKNENKPGGVTDAEKLQRNNQQLIDKFAEFDSMILAEREAVEKKNNTEGSGYNTMDGAFVDDESAGEDVTMQTAMINESSREAPELGSNIQTDSWSEIPPDIPSAESDDIIARQLREAAMKEKDPELRAKLWDEYRKYKKGA